MAIAIPILGKPRKTLEGGPTGARYFHCDGSCSPKAKLDGQSASANASRGWRQRRSAPHMQSHRHACGERRRGDRGNDFDIAAGRANATASRFTEPMHRTNLAAAAIDKLARIKAAISKPQPIASWGSKA
jgi:hypothetical protein